MSLATRTRMIVLAAVACAWSCNHGDRAASPQQGNISPSGESTVSEPGYPNVRVRLRLSRKAPALVERKDDVEIWLMGTKFRVRDEAGRELNEILGELTEPRGLGVPARTMEDIMDRNAAADRKPAGPTELYGDLATDEGWVYPPRSERWATSAKELALAAEQILSRDRAEGLQRQRDVTRLGRAGIEYHGVITVEEDGTEMSSHVTRVVSPPFLLFEQIRDAGDPEHYYVREVLSLQEGSVSAADVSPPGETPAR